MNGLINCKSTSRIIPILRNQQTFLKIEIELNEKVLALRSENAQLFEKIRLLEKKSPPNNDSNEQQHIYYHVPVSNSFSALSNKDNHEGTSILTENSSSEGLQLGEWTKVTKKNPRKKKNPQPKPTLSPTKSTQEVHQIETPTTNISPSPIVRESSYQHPFTSALIFCCM